MPKDKLDWVPIDAERLKRIYDMEVTQAGAHILFHTQLARVETREGRVTTILVTNKSGLSALSARVFVDCSGDADLCAWAGAKFDKGNEKGEDLMPATHCFVLTNVDEYAFQTGVYMHGSNPQNPIYKILKSGKYPLIPDSHLCSCIVGPRTVGFNAGHLWGVDNTNPLTTSKAMVQGRQMAQQYRDALAEYYPAAFGNAFLIATGSLMGIRETRRVIGDYVLKLSDYLERRSFEDEICRNSYFIDVHLGKEAAVKCRNGLINWEERTFRYKPGESHGIPYRCLTPKELSNVLVAGRSISCEQLVQGSVRVMPVCLAMGEAAGTAAAMAAGNEIKKHDVHQVNVDCLRNRLVEVGAYLTGTSSVEHIKK